MIEIKRTLKRKTDVWIEDKRLCVQLSPQFLEIWPKRARTRLRIDWGVLWREACQLDAHLCMPGVGQAPVDDRQESFDFQ